MSSSPHPGSPLNKGEDGCGSKFKLNSRAVINGLLNLMVDTPRLHLVTIGATKSAEP